MFVFERGDDVVFVSVDADGIVAQTDGEFVCVWVPAYGTDGTTFPETKWRRTAAAVISQMEIKEWVNFRMDDSTAKLVVRSFRRNELTKVGNCSPGSSRLYRLVPRQ